jgi:hypothetical protein
VDLANIVGVKSGSGESGSDGPNNSPNLFVISKCLVSREIGNLGAGTRFGGCGLEWFVDSLFAIIFERPTIIVQKSGGIEKLSVSVTLCG